MAWDNTWDTVIGQPISTIIIAFMAFLIAFGLTRKLRGKEYANDWLFDAFAGLGGIIIIGIAVFLVEVLLVVPKTIKLSNEVDQLTEDLAQKNSLIQVQNVTIQSYQAENSTLHTRLSDIESANDPSAPAVKKRALILCKQLEDFYQNYESNEESMTDQAMQQEQIETYKLGWPPPTNVVEKAEWQQKREVYFNDFNQKETAFESQWAAKFTTDYYGQIAAIRDQLASLGLKDPELDKHLESPFFTSAYWSQDLTMRIEHLANQIKE